MTWRLKHDQYIKHLETEYWQSATGKQYGDYDKREELEAEEKSGQRINMSFIDLLDLQTLLTFSFQLFGKKTTDKKVYKWTFMTFSVIFILYLFLRLMIEIVPSTGYVT